MVLNCDSVWWCDHATVNVFCREFKKNNVGMCSTANILFSYIFSSILVKRFMFVKLMTCVVSQLSTSSQTEVCEINAKFLDFSSAICPICTNRWYFVRKSVAVQCSGRRSSFLLWLSQNWSHFKQCWLSQSSSHMRVMNHNWSARKKRLHLQSAAGISRHLCYLISVCKSPFPSAGTAESLFHAKTVQ